MQDIVALNDFRVWIGKKRERITHFSAVRVANVTWVDADRGEMNTARFEIGKPFLKTPQLGVT